MLENTSTGGPSVEAQRPLQDAHLGVLVVLGERDRPAVAPGARRAAAAVEVVLAVAGGLVVDDGADVVDVDAASGHVGGDQHGQLAVGEPLQRPLAGGLGEVAVDRRGLHAELLQVALDAIARPLRLAEHDRLADRRRRSTATTLSLSMWCTARNRWCIVPTVSVGGVDRDLDRDPSCSACTRWPTSPSSVAENSIVWCGAVHLAQDPLDLRREAVVGHAVGLVEHDDLDRASRSSSFSFSRSISRSGVATTTSTPILQRVDLLVPRGAAVDGQHACVRTRCATGASTSDTCSASSRVGTSTSAVGRRGSPSPVKPGEQRHAEGERLAGAGAGAAAHVAALQRDRDRLGLDGERSGEPGGGEAAVDSSGTPRSAKPVGTYGPSGELERCQSCRADDGSRARRASEVAAAPRGCPALGAGLISHVRPQGTGRPDRIAGVSARCDHDVAP